MKWTSCVLLTLLLLGCATNESVEQRIETARFPEAGYLIQNIGDGRYLAWMSTEGDGPEGVHLDEYYPVAFNLIWIFEEIDGTYAIGALMRNSCLDSSTRNLENERDYSEHTQHWVFEPAGVKLYRIVPETMPDQCVAATPDGTLTLAPRAQEDDSQIWRITEHYSIDQLETGTRTVTEAQRAINTYIEGDTDGAIERILGKFDEYESLLGADTPLLVWWKAIAVESLARVPELYPACLALIEDIQQFDFDSQPFPVIPVNHRIRMDLILGEIYLDRDDLPAARGQFESAAQWALDELQNDHPRSVTDDLVLIRMRSFSDLALIAAQQESYDKLADLVARLVELADSGIEWQDTPVSENLNRLLDALDSRSPDGRTQQIIRSLESLLFGTQSRSGAEEPISFADPALEQLVRVTIGKPIGPMLRK